MVSMLLDTISSHNMYEFIVYPYFDTSIFISFPFLFY